MIISYLVKGINNKNISVGRKSNASSKLFKLNLMIRTELKPWDLHKPWPPSFSSHVQIYHLYTNTLHFWVYL